MLNLCYTIDQGSQTCSLPVHFTWPAHLSYSHYRMWPSSVPKSFFLFFSSPFSRAWRLKKFCYSWIAMYNIRDKRRKCSKGLNSVIIPYFDLVPQVWSILNSMFNFTRMSNSHSTSKSSVWPAYYFSLRPLIHIFLLFSLRYVWESKIWERVTLLTIHVH
jgi:hypothetical protein